MSRLLYMELTNFMSLPKAKVEFDERGIVSPVGYNDSGKSAITRACEVLWYDTYSTTQAKFITDGAEYFTIRQVYDDGVVVERTKYLTGSNHWRMTRDGQTVYDNQLPNGAYAASKGVPDVIQAYLRVFQDETSGEALNIRRNTNKLLLVATTGGDNYKFINNMAQGERLACATMTLTEDLNKAIKDRTNNATQLSTLRDSYSKLEMFTEAQEKELLKRSNALEKGIAQLSALCNLYEVFTRCNNEVIDEIALVDITQLNLLQNIKNSGILANRETVDEISEVDTTQYELLLHLKEKGEQAERETVDEIMLIDTEQWSKLMQIKQSSEGIKSVIDDIALIDTVKYEQLLALKARAEQLRADMATLSDTENKYSAMTKELIEIGTQNKWRICKNCGTVMTEGELHDD